MNLDDAQKRKVTDWIAQGLKLSDIQKSLEAEFGIRLTYLDVRLLVDDLKLTPKDQEPPKEPQIAASKPAAPESRTPSPRRGEKPVAAPAPGQVSVTVDAVARPNAMVSGSVTFSDGKKATWHFDEFGRLAVMPYEQGYKPPAADLREFQAALQDELQKMGF